MILTVNGEAFKIDKSATAADLIKQLKYQNQRIALEVNEDIIPKSRHAEFKLNAGDKIEIIRAVGGG
jgi:sulfur carrier protein